MQTIKVGNFQANKFPISEIPFKLGKCLHQYCITYNNMANSQVIFRNLTAKLWKRFLLKYVRIHSQIKQVLMELDSLLVVCANTYTLFRCLKIQFCYSMIVFHIATNINSCKLSRVIIDNTLNRLDSPT